MKVSISEVEWYPCYTAEEETDESGNVYANVCDGFLDEYKSVREEFDRMQKILRDLYYDAKEEKSR